MHIVLIKIRYFLVWCMVEESKVSTFVLYCTNIWHGTCGILIVFLTFLRAIPHSIVVYTLICYWP